MMLARGRGSLKLIIVINNNLPRHKQWPLDLSAVLFIRNVGIYDLALGKYKNFPQTVAYEFENIAVVPLSPRAYLSLTRLPAALLLVAMPSSHID